MLPYFQNKLYICDEILLINSKGEGGIEFSIKQRTRNNERAKMEERKRMKMKMEGYSHHENPILK